MSDEALEFAAKLSHLEKTTLRGMAAGDSCESGRATLLAELGLASGPDDKGIYVLSAFGQDVLECCDIQTTESVATDTPDQSAAASDQGVDSLSPSGG